MGDSQILVLEDEDPGFSYPIYGFTVTQGPPRVTGQNFAPSPTAVVSLTDSNISSPFQQDFGTNTRLSFTLPEGSELSPLTLFVTVGPNTNPVSVVATIIVNGSYPSGIRFPINVNAQTQSCVIPADQLVAGENMISMSFSLPNIAAQDVSVQSGIVSLVNASYCWRSIFAGIVGPGGGMQQSEAIQTGVEESNQEVYEFGVSIGVQYGAEASVVFGKISSTLSVNFSASAGFTHTITVSESLTTTDTLIVDPPISGDDVSFQFWQLCIVFSIVNTDLRITQVVPNFYVMRTSPGNANLKTSVG